MGVSKGFAIAFGLMAFTTFVYDTLDVCTSRAATPARLIASITFRISVLFVLCAAEEDLACVVTPNENAAKVLPPDAALVDVSDSEDDILPGEEPNLRALQSTVGLVWRALLLWMMLLLLASSAAWLG